MTYSEQKCTVGLLQVSLSAVWIRPKTKQK